MFFIQFCGVATLATIHIVKSSHITNEKHIRFNHVQGGQSELAPTSAPSKIDDMWLRNNFLLGSNSLSNYGG
jgi:hypothetical protein